MSRVPQTRLRKVRAVRIRDTTADSESRTPERTQLVDAVRSIPVALAVFLVIGLGLRIALSLAYQPAGLRSFDTTAYIWAGAGNVFEDPSRTAGYPMFLAAIGSLSRDIDVTIWIQHLLGLATACITYAAFRRLGTPVWVAICAAAGFLLSIDQVFLEHSILSESPFTLLLAIVIYAAVRALPDPRPVGRLTARTLWLTVAAIALGLASWIRPVAVPLIAVLAIWAALAFGGSARVRLGYAAAAAVPAVALVLIYCGIQAADNGHFGLTRSTGWATYSRAAPFADCDRFQPPMGTEGLCETSPPDERWGPDFYAWVDGSPARRLFGEQPNGNAELGDFGRAAILHQPLDYVAAVVKDELRYFVPSLEDRLYWGPGVGDLDVDVRESNEEGPIIEAINAAYGDEQIDISEGTVSALGDFQRVVRLNPVVMVLVTAFGLVGLVLARGRLRMGLAMILACTWVLLLFPAVAAVWSARYAVPVTGQLVGTAAVGIWLTAHAVTERRRSAAQS